MGVTDVLGPSGSNLRMSSGGGVDILNSDETDLKC